MSTLLGFDFGEKRIGVAIGNTITRTARPLAVLEIEQRAARFLAIEKLLEEWQPDQLVVGIPSHPDGTAHAMTARCQRFANQLHGRFALPVKTVDERYSSVEAQSEEHVHARGEFGLDAVAAQIILQHYLDQDNSHNDRL